MSSPKILLALGVASAALVVASQASAAGFYLQEQSVRGTGRAYSGEVADRGAASLWWNPAAIAGIQSNEVYGGMSLVMVDSEVSNTGSTIDRVAPGVPVLPVGGDQRAYDPIKGGIVPNLSGAFRVTDRLAVGVSTYAPYNFTTAYSGDSFTRYDALKSRLMTANIQGTAAYRVTDWLDVGVGVNAIYADATLTSAYPNVSPLQPDGRSELTGDGWDFGWNAGVQLHPTNTLTIGVSYRSEVKHTLDGSVVVSGLLAPAAAANMDVDGKAKITTPWIATLGARWAVTDKLTLNAQAQRIGWGEFDAIRVSYAGGGFESDQNYKDVTSGGVGFDYAVNEKLTVRAGVQYDPTPTPDIGRTARVPDGDRWLYGAGATINLKPNLALDIAGAYIAFDEAEIVRDDVIFGGTPLATPVALRGKAEGSGVIMAAGARWTF